ncbi:MAG: lysophospholipid acyltransferase family protein [Litoreibacter sp.]|nr:lysophospholipid acyltransferase family protein [Litoreibacter sp.]
MTWNEMPEEEIPPLSGAGYLRAFLRGLPLALLVLLCLVVLLIMRAVEAPLFGVRRPLTPYITRFVCRTGLRVLGIRLKVTGKPMSQLGGVVANHASWLDIFSLNASDTLYFVSKAEVAKWPGIGLLARSVGTVFIRRDPNDAAQQKSLFEQRLKAGHKLLFFPEGTSSDGRRVLPFKSTLFAAFFADELRQVSFIQPVSVSYIAPEGQSLRFYGWWGDMDFAPHLIQTLGAAKQGRIEVVYHPALKVSDYPDRKALARACEEAVRSGLNPKVLSET